MKKNLCVIVIIILGILIVACTGNREYNYGESTRLKTSEISKTPSMTGDLPQGEHPTAIIGTLPSTFHGRIWIQHTAANTSEIMDGESGIISKNPLLSGCIPLNDISQGICQTKSGNLVRVDLQSKLTEDITDFPVQYWRMTSNQKYISYAFKVEKDQYSLAKYDLGTTESSPMGLIDMNDWLIPPALSSDGNEFIGPYVGFAKTQLGLLKDASISSVGTQSDYVVTPNVEWSPTEPILGFGSSSVEMEIGWCTDAFFIYDADRQQATLISTLPSGECYSDFGYLSSIWSDDGKKVALINNQDLCVIDIQTRIQECYRIAAGNDRIDGYSWSPDTKAIAILISGVSDQILVFPLKSKEIEYVKNIEPADSIRWLP